MRHQNRNWNVSNDELPEMQAAHLAVLMDIRDELQQLNRVLACHNFVAVPTILREIAKHTKRRQYNKRTPKTF